MNNFIPIFPLELVVYPGEELNLHIFEPRYKQLILETRKNKKKFGIPSVIGGQVSETGTLMELVEIKEVYENGEMDIRTKGVKVFRILELVKSVPDKLYGGAIVNYLEDFDNGNKTLMKKVVAGIRELHSILKVNKEFKKSDEALCSYDLAHHAGLSLIEEYDLLQLEQELQRQEYLRQHLLKVLPVVTEMETLKGRIQLNGHFKNLTGFDF
jgi:Lon protease-like protein